METMKLTRKDFCNILGAACSAAVGSLLCNPVYFSNLKVFRNGRTIVYEGVTEKNIEDLKRLFGRNRKRKVKNAT